VELVTLTQVGSLTPRQARIHKPTPLLKRKRQAPKPRVPLFSNPEQMVQPIVQMKTPDQRKQEQAQARAEARARRGAPLPPTRHQNPHATKHPSKYKPKKIGENVYGGNVPREFEGRYGIVMATGPGLTPDVIEMIRPYHEDGTVVALGCNDAYRACDYLDVMYACDPPWWDIHVWERDLADHPAVKWTQDYRVVQKYGINHIKGVSANGFSDHQNLIHFGGNSGYQVLNLALLYGCKEVALCGYNMGMPPGQGQHFFGMHPKPLNQSNSFGSFISAFNTIGPAHRKRIVNCTPQSKLTAFEKRPLKEVLDQWKSLVSSGAEPPSSSAPDPHSTSEM
jgi:hypothetical protein